MPDPSWSNRRTAAFAITPDDGRPVQGPKDYDGKPITYTNAIHALTAGNVCAKFLNGGDTVTFPVLAGVKYDYALRMVYATGTTATLIGLL